MKARLPEGGRIDRERALAFTFNGERLQGFAGDTLASALLANDVHLVARSIKLHRPRGIVGRGPEEPNALLQVGRGAGALPNMRATELPLSDGLEVRSVNGRPGVNTDLMAAFDFAGKLMPAGFYYKTFMAPRGWWERYERIIRPAAGTGLVPDGPDPDRYEKVETHCDVLVAGAGAAGLAAALTAARAGARVILADEQGEPGGGLLASRGRIAGRPAADWVAAVRAELEGLPEARVLPSTTVFGHYDHRFVGMLERVHEQRPGAPVRERFWRVRTRQLVIAAGAIERPIAFPHNDRPGIMTASAVREYVERYAVRPGRAAVILTNNDSAYATARSLLDAGARVTVVDVRREPGEAAAAARGEGARVLPGSVIAGSRGRRRVRQVALRGPDGREQALDCDLVAVSGGWNPSVHLHSHARGELRWAPALASFVPADDLPYARSVGACRGTFDLAAAIAEGLAAGAECAKAAGCGDGRVPSAPAVTDAEPGPDGLEVLWRVRGRGPAFIDLQNDVKASDLELALREGYRSIEHVKRYSVLGFGTDQGKLGNLVGMGIVAEALGRPPEEVGTTTYRPAWTPVTFGALVGPETGALFQPIRRTPMHEWHQAQGAVFEDVGQWKRARYYPRGGEDMDAAVARECLATHRGVGVLDYSTLGKIDIQGRDAVTLLERVYTNNWRKLAVGRCRYGLMLDENGMVLDDGVTARLGEQHYLMYTSTGGAARVLAWLERWLQTEWPELEVYLTSVTDHWATVSLAGPRSRDLLRDLGTDIPLDAESFPFMSLRTGSVAGMPARVQRVSFSGELTFEVSVPADHGLDLWERVMAAGEGYGATPYGTETMHVLRAEKGFIIVGQDTDGSISPLDLGMGGLVSQKKDCLGGRSLQRRELQRADRAHWVGLAPEDPDRVVPEGAQLVADPEASPPVPMHGWVTSSYHAARLGRSIALGFVNGGRERHGERLYAWDVDAGAIPLTVTSPVLFDPEGVRQNV